MQPGLTLRVVTPAVHKFRQDVSVVPSETADLLVQSVPKASHQVVVALIPQPIPMRKIALHAFTECLNAVLSHRFGIERW